MNEQMVFQALMQFAQHNIYTKQMESEAAVTEAKKLVEKMITEAKAIADSHNEPT